MNKYYFVLYHGQCKDFLDQLQDVGLVDITTTGWEPGEEDRALLQSIDLHKQAIKRITELAVDKRYQGAEPYANGHLAFENYLLASSNLESLDSRIVQAEKEFEDFKKWGDVDLSRLERLKEAGVELKYFSTYAKEFLNKKEEWSNDYNMTLISNADNGMAYFVVIASPDQDIFIDAHQMKAPTMTLEQKKNEIDEFQREKTAWEETMARVVASAQGIKAMAIETREHLQRNQVSSTSRSDAEGTLTILQGWATKESSKNVDKMLEEYPNLVYLKSTPTPQDDTPVVLNNNKYAKAFEFIGNFYNTPKYGTMDLTAFFAPFYMIFFGFCLADAGYGLLVLLGGFFLLKKGGSSTNLVSKLSMWCGAATVVFGLLQGSFFGIDLGQVEWFARFRSVIVLNRDNLFILALVFGVIQLLFAMGIKVYCKAKAFGFKYIFSTLGWMLVLIALVIAIGLPLLGVPVKGFESGSVPFFITVGVGLFMMLFLNSPGKNPFLNFGKGLWNTYNDITGTLGDFLSYIRLFAIGLSGSILAQVFNDLAFGMSPDIPVVKQLVVLIILLIGHGLNLFMSTLSSFVHPMRLTFVEFYKNAGFEAGERKFSPLKRENKI